MTTTQWFLLNIGNGIYHVAKIILHYLMCLVNWSGGQKVPSVQDPILLMSATELAEQIRKGKLTSECVVRAFIRRILIVEPFLNATVDRRFNEALEEAREVDALIQSGTVSKQQLAKEKPLLGVPFTVKVLLTVKGLRRTGASLLFKDEIADEDAPTVSLMKEAGAIALATTNSPELGCNFETNNHAHGSTNNPYDTSKTSGGSSGGEAALLGAAGSVIGLGNDLGGSVRLPSMFCGVFAHKPTRGLVSNEGCFPVIPEKCKSFVYTGPMCRYAQDLVTTMKILSTRPNMFEQKVNFQDLKIYYLFSHENMPFVKKVHPDIKECIQKAVSYFETKHGSKVKEVNIPLFKMAIGIALSTGIKAVPNFGHVMTAGRADVSATKELFKSLFRQSQFTIGPILILFMFQNSDFVLKEETFKYFEEKKEQLDKELNNLLDERSVLIMPTLPFTAPYHYEVTMNALNPFAYTGIFNFLGHPSTQCPVGFDRKGMPAGIQIVGGRGNDHLTIACAVELEKAFGGWKPPT